MLEQEIEVQEMLSPYDNFAYALNAKETRRHYPHRLDKFLVFLGLHGTIEEKCMKLYEIGKDVNQLHFRLIKFINSQKERTLKNESCQNTFYLSLGS
jgi:hypothetical protein